MQLGTRFGYLALLGNALCGLRQLGLDSIGLERQAFRVLAASLDRGPGPLFDQLLELQLQTHSVINRSKIAHARFYPVGIGAAHVDGADLPRWPGHELEHLLCSRADVEAGSPGRDAVGVDIDGVDEPLAGAWDHRLVVAIIIQQRRLGGAWTVGLPL